MKKFWIQFVFLVSLALGLIFLAYNRNLIENYLPANSNFAQTKIKIADSIINIEVADSASKRSRGLSGRESLASDSGMLFVFPEEKKYQFWMKGMKIPLDFIFIRKGMVVDLLPNMPAPVVSQADQNLPIYSPIVPIDMMLEVNAGFIGSKSIKVGDNVFLIENK